MEGASPHLCGDFFTYKNMKYKQIIILVGVIFIAFVGYKIISSNIQKNKEEAVLQEKYRLDQLQINQETANQQKIAEGLDLCLNDANNVADKNSASIFVMAKCWGVGILDNGSYASCISNMGQGREICQLQSGTCSDVITETVNGIKDQLEKDKQDC